MIKQIMKKELKNVFILCACENNTFSDHKLVFVEIDFEPAAQNRFCLLIINCQIIYEMKNNALHYARQIGTQLNLEADSLNEYYDLDLVCYKHPALNY